MKLSPENPSADTSRAAGRLERFISWSVIGLLIVIAVLVYRSQNNLNPAVEALYEIQSDSVIKQAGSEARQEAFFKPPTGFSPLSPPERFDPQTLSDKINGKAELYLPAGFRSLFAQRLVHDQVKDVWFEVFFYDMGTRLNAFSVFSAQRRDDAASEPFARFAYRSENALFWVHGPYYAEIIASEARPGIRDQLLELAAAFNKQKSVSSGSIVEIDLFPEEGMKPQSVAYIPVNAFGFEGLDRVFTAIYRIGEENEAATAFISRRESSEEAQKKAEEFVQFMLSFGGVNVSGSADAPGAEMVNFLDAIDAVAARGPFIVGVHEAPDVEYAARLLEMILEKIGEK